MIVEGKRVDITCIADLHGHYPELEGGDLLIVAGDLTRSDTEQNWFDFLVWITNQASLYKRIIVVAGNHDSNLEKYVGHLWPYNGMISYLCDWGTQFEYVQPINNSFNPDDKSLVYRKTLKIWGSPWTKRFEGANPNCTAFMVDTDEELELKWKLIPDDVDILITHCPPQGMQDYRPLTLEEKRFNIRKGYGSESLSRKIWELDLNGDGKTRLLVCGHIHEGYGVMELSSMLWDKRTWRIINASHVNENYEPVNRPIRVIL
jgi:Icc-related predicted phosphoesterase